MKKNKPDKAPPTPFAALRELRDKMAKEAEDAEKAKKAGTAPKAAPAAATRPRSPAPKTAARGNDAEDELAFHRLMSGVTPLDEKKARVSKTDVPRVARVRPERAPDDTMEHLRVLVEEGSKFEVVDDGRRVEGHRVDVPPDFVRKLRRGGFPVDGSLDLHGKTAEQSREAIATFLRDKRARGERCVLIIHGKGEQVPGEKPGAPVLRGEISAWLSQGAASNHVAAFATAQDEDGGAGAVYVLLRR